MTPFHSLIGELWKGFDVMSNDQAIFHGCPFEKIGVRDSLKRCFLRDDVIEVWDAQLEAIKNHLGENGVKPWRNPSTWISVLVFLIIMLAVGIILYNSLTSGG